MRINVTIKEDSWHTLLQLGMDSLQTRPIPASLSYRMIPPSEGLPETYPFDHPALLALKHGARPGAPRIFATARKILTTGHSNSILCEQ
jgi:hypothetical protein